MLAIEAREETVAVDDGAPEVAVLRLGARRPPALARWRPVALMVAGLVAVGAASMGLVHLLSSRPGEGRAGTRPPVPAPASSGVALGGPSDVSVQSATYEPFQGSGWHAHTGMHAVLVLSGTLTVYDAGCQARTYGPGDTYVGGQDLHLARNETATPVQMAVTYLFPAGVSHTRFHVPSPPPVACSAAKESVGTA